MQAAAAGAAGALVAPAAPPAAAAPVANAQQNRSIPLVLPQLNDLHKIFQRGGLGAHNNEPIGIPQQCAISQQLIQKWQPYLLLQHRFWASSLGGQLKLHAQHSCVDTHDDSALRSELEGLEPEGENAKVRRLWYNL